MSGIMYLQNSFVILIVFTISSIVFLANFIFPSIIEKIKCEIIGGWWDSMLKSCGMDSQICVEKDGTPVQIFGKCGGGKQCNASSVSIFGRKFE